LIAWFTWPFGLLAYFLTFTKGDPAKMCVSGKPGYRGCNLVNARYDRQRL